MPPTKEELLAFRERMARYNAWEAENPEPPLEPQQALQFASSLYRLLPPERRLDNDDPTYAGARLMYDRLSVLGSSRG